MHQSVDIGACIGICVITSNLALNKATNMATKSWVYIPTREHTFLMARIAFGDLYIAVV